MFLGQFFAKNAKNDPRTLLNGPSRTKFEIQVNTEIAGNGMKNGRFRPSKHQNSGIFQDIYLKFCTHIGTPGSVLSLVLRFFEISNNFAIF